MDVAAAIRARILAISAATTLVSGRVWTGPSFPQAPTLPGVKVMRVPGGVEPMHLKGVSGLKQARVQIDILAARRADAVAVDDAIDGNGAGSGLSGWSGEIAVSPPFVILLVEPIDPEPRELFDDEERKEVRLMREYRVSFTR